VQLAEIGHFTQVGQTGVGGVTAIDGQFTQAGQTAQVSQAGVGESGATQLERS
jgi:hypothetical protein